MNTTFSYNKRAAFDYELMEKYEAGLVLEGQEVKSIKSGRVSLAGAFVVIKKSPKTEAFLINASIPPYQPQNTPAHYDQTRARKLLLKKREISSLMGKTAQKGLTLVPVRVYLKRGLIKLEFALAKGKKKFDKRETIKKREAKRDIQRTLKR